MLKRILFIIALSLCVFSYGQEIVYSENIQNTFFGVKFGSSKEDVINAFEKKELYINKTSSSIENLNFLPKNQYCTFGKKDWDVVSAIFSNNKFHQIIFMRFFSNKEIAIKYFATVFADLSSIYNMNNMPAEHSNIYVNYTATTNDRKGVGLYLSEEQNSNKETWFYISLFYYDNNFTVSDEF